MNWTDYVIIAVLALSVLIGLWRGLIAEVLALAVWVAAVWLAWLFGPRVAAAFEGVIEVPSVRIIAGYALCFLAVLLIGALLKFVMDKLVKSTGLSGSDRMLGMLFGLARGVLLVTLLVFLLGFTPFTRDPWWHRSQLLPTFVSAADWMGQYVPQSVHKYLHPDTPAAPHINIPEQMAALPGKAAALSADVRHALAPSALAPGTSTPPVPAARVAPAPHSRDN